MKVILFGAGASFGSVAVKPYAPPLGPNLFEKLEEKGGVAATVPDDIKALFNENFEIGMKAYNKHTNNNSMAFQRELAGYLAEFSPSEGNVYGTLLREIGVNNITYASLNYDLLFELSAGQLGYGINYSSNRQTKMASLLKIHGSSNFWPSIPVGQMDGAVFENCRVDIEAPVKPLDQNQTLYRCTKERGLAPAIAHYAEGKAIKVSPEFVSRQLEKWKESVANAKKVAIIGVKVHEVDDHIWDVLGKSKAHLWYIGFNSDKPAFDAWKGSHSKRNAYFIESDFENCIPVLKKRFKGN